MMTPEEIKQARLALGLTQKELAIALGWTTARNVINLEGGHKTAMKQTELAIKYLLSQGGV